MPVQIPLINKSTKGIININLLVEVTFKDDERKAPMTNGLMEIFKTYSIENAKECIHIFKTLNDRQSLELMMDKYITKDTEESINILKEIKDTTDITFIKDWFNRKVQNLFDEYFKTLPIKTIEHQIAIGGWLIKHLNIQNISMIHKIIESNPNVENEKLFQLLETLNYSLNDIFFSNQCFERVHPKNHQ